MRGSRNKCIKCHAGFAGGEEDNPDNFTSPHHHAKPPYAVNKSMVVAGLEAHRTADKALYDAVMRKVFKKDAVNPDSNWSDSSQFPGTIRPISVDSIEHLATHLGEFNNAGQTLQNEDLQAGAQD